MFKKLIFCFIAILFTFSTYAVEDVSRFEIKYIEDESSYFLFDKKDGNRIIEVVTNGGTPKIEKILKPSKNYLVLIIYTGSAGTSSMTDFKDAFIFDNKFKFRAMLPYSVNHEGEEALTVKFEKDKIQVFKFEKFYKQLDL